MKLSDCKELFRCQKGDIVEDYYDHRHYRVIENDRHAMGKVMDLSDGRVSIWNSCCNCRFVPLKGQMELWK